MKEKSITTNQICALFIALIPLTKLITAPAVLSGYLQERLWHPLILLFALDIALIFLFLYFERKHSSATFFEILSNNYSKGVAKGIFFIYALYFFAKSFIPIIEQKELIENAFYETLPQVPAFFPVFLVIFYICLKGFKTLGRLSQFCLFLSLFGISLILFLSIPTAEYSYLLPIINVKPKSEAIVTLKALSWFNDAIYLLFFMGYFKREKKDKTKLIVSYLICVAIVVLYFVTFYGIFTYISPTQKIALNYMSIFGVTLVNVGRFDYLALFLLTTASVVSISLPLVFSTYCLKEVFGLKEEKIPAIVVTACAFLLTVFFSSKYELILTFVTKYLTPLYVICGYVLPFLCFKGENRDLQKG